MKKRRMFTAFSVLLITVACIFGAIKSFEILKEIGYEAGFSLDAQPPPDPLNAELARTVSRYRRAEISMIDISTITTFSWNQLYMFGQYASASKIDPIVGRSWRDIPRCSYVLGITPMSDTDDLLVFTRENKVVHCMLNSTFPRFGGFDTAHVSSIPREKALFVIVKDENDYEWLVPMRK